MRMSTCSAMDNAANKVVTIRSLIVYCIAIDVVANSRNMSKDKLSPSHMISEAIQLAAFIITAMV